MDKKEILLTSVLVKIQEAYVGKIGLSSVYEIRDAWVLSELEENGICMAQSVSDFEEALADKTKQDVVVSAYLINKPALEKMVMRCSNTHRIFYSLV